MRFWTIAAGVIVAGVIAAGAVLWFLAPKDASWTQFLRPKEVLVPKGGDQQARPMQPEGTQANGGQPTWRVNCSSSQAGLDCRVTQTLFVRKTGQRFLIVAIRVAPETKQPIMWIQTPLRTYLPAGVSLQFGQDPAKSVPIRNCDRSGCLATYPVTEAEISAMEQATGLTVSIQDLQKRPITLRVPVQGFAEAYARIK